MTSKNPTGRPRRVAGSGAKRAQRASDAAVVEEVAQQPSRDQVTDAPAPPEPVVLEKSPSPGSPGLETGASAPSSTTDELETGASAPSSTTDELETGAGAPSSTTDELEEAPPARRTTLALVVTVVVLVAVLALEAAYLWGPLRDDPTVSSARPVLVGQATERSAVDTAAKAAVAFSARSYDTYDEQVDAAAAMMTDDFAESFRQTTDDAKAKFVEAEAQVTAEVAAQGVMTASDEQVEVLLFLNQFTVKKDEKSGFTPFRLKVTLIDTEQGWLVSDVDAS
jgi:Mce-associated membrane protein